MSRKKVLRAKMRKMFILYALIPVFLLFFLFFFMLTYHERESIYGENISKNIYISNLIENELINYKEEIKNLSESELLKDVLVNNEDGAIKRQLYEDIYSIINGHEIKSMFVVADEKGLVLLSNRRIEEDCRIQDKILWGILRKMQYYEEDVSTNIDRQQISESIRTVYSMGKPVVQDERIIGYIIFDLIESEIIEIIDQQHIEVFIATDSYDNAIVFTNESLLNNVNKFKPEISNNIYIKDENAKYSIYKKSILEDEINIYTMIQIGHIDEFLLKGFISFSVLFLILAAVLYLAIRIFSKNLIRPIDDLLEVMEDTRSGNFSRMVNIKTNDEFEELGDYYNKTLVEIKRLMKKNEENAIRTKVGEIKQLQSQFNPHFLYNTLESLKYMVRIDPDVSVEMIVSLGNILRYSISQKYEEVKFRDDIQYVFDYLLLLKYRYGDNFNYDIKFDKKVRDCLIPKLIIQPLIENSILHNFKNKKELNIDVNCYVKDKNLVIEVNDNGEGIDKKLLEKINKLLDKDYTESEHVGLVNTHRRIKLKYGEKYGLEIESKKGVGTTVSIRLPFIKK